MRGAAFVLDNACNVQSLALATGRWANNLPKWCDGMAAFESFATVERAAVQVMVAIPPKAEVASDVIHNQAHRG